LEIVFILDYVKILSCGDYMIYSNSYYKYYIIIPITLAIISILALPYLPKAVDITGGTSISAVVPVSVNVDDKQIISALSDLNLRDLSVSVAENPLSNQKMYLVEFAPIKKEDNATSVNVEIKRRLAGLLGISESDINVQEIGPTIGKMFWESGLRALVFAFLFMGAVVFLTFRELAPSTYVISAAILDVLYALLGMVIFRIPLSLATLAAMLMLIGYSVDTDILLTNKVIKRKEGDVDSRIASAMKTGLTMTGTTLTALIVMTLAAWMLHTQTLVWIGATLTFGLVGDLISTWLMNAVILKWWVTRKS